MKLRTRTRLFAAVVAAGVVTFAFAINAPANDTVQDFSAEFNPSPPPLRMLVQQNGSDPGPELSTVNAWDGSFLRLTHEVNSQNASVAWNQVYEGDYEALQVDLDFRMTTGGSGADGIGIAYFNSSLLGEDTSTLTPSFSEEPNFTGSWGIGIDNYNNGDNDGGENTVSLHWDGQLLISESIDFESDIFTFEDGIERTATILVEPSGGGSQISVTIAEEGLDPITPIDEFVAGMLPYDGRLAIAGRTGGANADQELDNLRLTVTPIGGAPTLVMHEQFNDIPEPPAVVPPTILGGTPFTRTQFNETSNPGPTLTPGNGPAETDGFMRLATQVGSQSNGIAFDQTAESLGETITVEFDFRILNEFNASGSADGMSFVLMSTELDGAAGPMPQAVSEEANLVGAIGIGFDSYDNDEEGINDPDGCGDGGACVDRRANHISLHWDGSWVDVNDDGVSDNKDYVWLDRDELDLVNGEWNHATIVVATVEDGANLSMTIDDGSDGSTHAIFEEQFMEDAEFVESVRAAFGARTGGAADHHDIDNVNIQFGGAVLLQPGDADQNLAFDQLDLVKVQIAAKYLTGDAATWGDGDWNSAPTAGGVPGSPPAGNGLFDQVDIIAALTAGKYLTGPYGAVGSEGTGDGNVSLVYDPASGELAIDVPATELTSINIDSAASIFTGDPAGNLGGSFDNDADNNIFKATFGGSFGSLTFGNAAQAGLSEEFLQNDLTVVGSLAGGGDLGAVDLIYVPEPSTFMLLMGSVVVLLMKRRRS